MIINGVTLPDIPAGVLAQYPYVVIVKVVMEGEALADYGGSVTGYTGWASTGRIAAIPPGMPAYSPDDVGADDYCIVVTETNLTELDAQEGDEAWVVNERLPADIGVWAMGFGDATDLGMPWTVTNELVWANHDICVVEEMDYDTDIPSKISTEVYFAKSSEESNKPSRYSIAATILEGIAKHIRRLTITEDKVKPENMGAMLETVRLTNDLPHAEEVKF